jgi:pimeloyl-ACP methyl ester carboxylesterase
MDATDAGEAILVGLSFGGLLACVPRGLPSGAGEGRHPVRCAGMSGRAPAHDAEAFPAPARAFEGWTSTIARYWLAHYPDFAEHFVRNIFSEPHSTKQIEDGVAGPTRPTAGAGEDRRGAVHPADVRRQPSRCTATIRCPCWSIHGDDDQIQPYGAAS